MTLPDIRMRPREAGRVARGHPWAYSNELQMTAQAKALPPGAVVRLANADGRFIASGFFNPHSLIAFRLLSRFEDETIDQGFFERRISRALSLRDRLFDRPFYRLVHAEADGLPGLVIDRFGPALSVQMNAAGMDAAREMLLAALGTTLAPAAIVLKNDSGQRALEGLAQSVEIVSASPGDGPVALLENGLRFYADPMGGQKTGWFYDHRENRAFAARLAEGARVLDLYSYAGGFGINAAKGGATSVLMVDRSEASLSLSREAAAANGLSAVCDWRAGEAFDFLEKAADAGERFDLVLTDPPAFVKSKKALASGLKGYRKLTRLAARCVSDGGVLMIASCSHHVGMEALIEEVRAGLAAAGREGRILRLAGAGPDHPLHPHLPESAYLKAIFLALD